MFNGRFLLVGVVYSARSGKREERVIYDETPVGCGCAKYNCAMLVIYSREEPGMHGQDETKEPGRIVNRVHSEPA